MIWESVTAVNCEREIWEQFQLRKRVASVRNPTLDNIR